MVAADGKKCFRTFLFIFANRFLHEIAHIFVTYLDKGRSNTPPRIRAEVGGYSREDMGEAGRYLETTLFGGTLEYYRDHAMDDSQVRPIPSHRLAIFVQKVLAPRLCPC